jgi:hypothetical protein
MPRLKLYRLAHWSHGRKVYALRVGAGIRFTEHRGSATLYPHADARAIARRLRKLSTRLKLEAA